MKLHLVMTKVLLNGWSMSYLSMTDTKLSTSYFSSLFDSLDINQRNKIKLNHYLHGQWIMDSKCDIASARKIYQLTYLNLWWVSGVYPYKCTSNLNQESNRCTSCWFISSNKSTYIQVCMVNFGILEHWKVSKGHFQCL